LYIQFIRFLSPLVVATVALELSGQFLNGGMARVPRATETLAAFGLAFGLMSILSGPLYQSRQLALGIIDNRLQLRTATRSVVVAGIVLSCATALFGLQGPGRWIVDLHGITPDLADQAQTAILLMSPLPLINGMARYYSGLLARYRRTEIVSVSSIGGIIVRISSVFLLLNEPFVQSRPILLPIIVTALGSVVEFLILLWGHLRFARPALPSEGTGISISEILKFLWPLAVIMTFQGASRPLINFVVARGTDATEALAVLTIVYALGHIHYGWVNELRSLVPAFRDEKSSLYYVRRFAIACCLISFVMALILFWTPIRAYLLLDLIGIDQRLANLCAAPLMIFTFFPFAVTLRGYYHGVGIVRRMTDAMALSAPSRLTAISIALVAFSFTDVAGATMGIGALFCGFAAESSMVSWGVRRRIKKQKDGDAHV
jgi:progressive ankylosis protein